MSAGRYNLPAFILKFYNFSTPKETEWKSPILLGPLSGENG